MPDASEYKFEVELEGVGKFSNITSWSIQQGYTTPSDGFDFTVTDHKHPEKLRQTFRPWQNVSLYLNGCLQLMGRIDATEGTGPGEIDLRCYGRDYFAAFVDPPVDPAFRITAGDTLATALMRLLAPFGVDTIYNDGNALLRNVRTGKSSTGTPVGFSTISLEDVKPSDGQGVFDFVTALLSRHGFTLQPTLYRNEVCVAKPEYGANPIYNLRRNLTQPAKTNITSGVAKRDYTDVPTLIACRGRQQTKSTDTAARSATPTLKVTPAFGAGSPSTIGDLAEVKAIVGAVAGQELIKSGTMGDPSKVYKPLYYRDDKAKTQDQLTLGLQRELAERLKNTLTYRVEVPRVAAEDGTIYTIDTSAQVDDDAQGVHETLWIAEKTVGDSGSGPSTTLELIRPGSFVL